MRCSMCGHLSDIDPCYDCYMGSSEPEPPDDYDREYDYTPEIYEFGGMTDEKEEQNAV